MCGGVEEVFCVSGLVRNSSYAVIWDRKNLLMFYYFQAGEEVDISNVLRERDMLQQERDFFRNQYNDISRRIAQITATTPSVSQTIVSVHSAWWCVILNFCISDPYFGN